MIEFTVVKESSERRFAEEVEVLLNDGFHIEKIAIDRSGTWVYYIAFMMKGI